MRFLRAPIWFLLAFLMIFTSAASPGRGATNLSNPDNPHRTGGWLDTINFSVTENPEDAITMLQEDELDIYAGSVSGPTFFDLIKYNPNLDYSISYGSYTELSFNPHGPYFNDGRLNPFYNASIREAMNQLMDRQFIVDSIYGGFAQPKLLALSPISADNTRYSDWIEDIEAQYAYNPDAAIDTITSEMTAMGAVQVEGKWWYNGEPITIIFLIRVEDERLAIGDYASDQLETAGFTVDRQYCTRTECSPIWVQGDPAEGLFHIYTGGWLTTAVSRDDSSNFSFFYTPFDYPIPLFGAYQPSQEFEDVALALRNFEYSSQAERDALFEQAIPLSINDSGSGSVRIWISDETAFTPRRADVLVSSDLASGVEYSQSWALTVRFDELEGGSLKIAQAGLLYDPWNPIAGSNWVYDSMPIRASSDYGTIVDPDTGLPWPQRIDHADVTVQSGLPVQSTLPWVNLQFEDTIVVPDDAWVSWDPVSQTFITAAEAYTTTITALTRSTVYYPADLFSTVKWHDDSPLDLSDFVMRMIMNWDPNMEQSDIYDPYYDTANSVNLLKGVRIVSEDPLVIETYLDTFALDAELIPLSWFPTYNYGPGAWHNLTPAILAEANGELAFGFVKAEELGVEWTNFISGFSLDVMDGYADECVLTNCLPYAPTLSDYVTIDEIQERWSNLQTWYNTYQHFWIGTGPYYLSQANPDSQTLVLNRFPDFPDPSEKWDNFVYDRELAINYNTGAPGSYFTISATGYPAETEVDIYLNSQTTFTATTTISGTLEFVLDAAGAEEGQYRVSINDMATQTVVFNIDAAEPVRPLESPAGQFIIPENIAYTNFLFLPVLDR